MQDSVHRHGKASCTIINLNLLPAVTSLQVEFCFTLVIIHFRAVWQSRSFQIKIKIWIGSQVMWLSYHLTKQNGLVCYRTFSFFRLLFEYWISGPKSYLEFRETRHRPRYREKQRAEHHGKNAKRALAKAGAFWAVRGQNKNCRAMLRSNSMLSPWCCLFSFKSEVKSCLVCNYWFYKTFSFQASSNCS